MHAVRFPLARLAPPHLTPLLRALVLGVATWCAPAAVGAETWTSVRWHDEEAYELSTAIWRAVVSVERGRLVHFGPADSATSFVFAPAAKSDSAGWGGHRVWLGPQNTWRRFWPPPPAWEQSAAESVQISGPTLTLRMPDAGDGWPRLTRTYALDDRRLACRIFVESAGTREVQIMQILQTIPTGEAVVPIIASPAAPLGCLLLPPFQRRQQAVPLADQFPDYLSRAGETLRVRHSMQLDKIAFPPQELVARYGTHVLRLARGSSRGRETGTPDQGFYTQICPGADNMPVIELEQMSPLFAAGEVAEFTMLLGLTAE